MLEVIVIIYYSVLHSEDALTFFQKLKLKFRPRPFPHFKLPARIICIAFVQLIIIYYVSLKSRDSPSSSNTYISPHVIAHRHLLRTSQITWQHIIIYYVHLKSRVRVEGKVYIVLPFSWSRVKSWVLGGGSMGRETKEVFLEKYEINTRFLHLVLNKILRGINQ